MSWLVAAGLATAALITPSAALAAGPGNNGLDATGNGTKSNATFGGSLADAGNSAVMDGSQGGSTLTCDGDSAGTSTGSFTLTKTLDVGSKITVYLVPNNGSNADPEVNVAKNETTITLNATNNTSGSVINWSITVTSPFTVSSGGILGVFAVNDDGVTAIGSDEDVLAELHGVHSEHSAEQPAEHPAQHSAEQPAAPAEHPAQHSAERSAQRPAEPPPSTPPSEAPSGSVWG